ncbi:MAG: FIG00456093: hypothetical protein [uncultured Paraburkholderia sp.]|nr:MAG: FIG00456093: hypothetical protein [uncultured Paraburkholderia sp.]CAH2932776.1 MAG: FIG00456093: hypothetical protein [uncultured Paraburkholderia sp.]
MKRSRWAAATAGIAFTLFCTGGVTAFAQQPQKPADDSMAKPPEAASGSSGSSNPDNMPIKRPNKPTNDRMMHLPPASGANAK